MYARVIILVMMCTCMREWRVCILSITVYSNESHSFGNG